MWEVISELMMELFFVCIGGIFVYSGLFIILWILKQKKLWCALLTICCVVGMIVTPILSFCADRLNIATMSPEEKAAYYEELEQKEAEKAAKEKEEAEKKAAEEKKKQEEENKHKCKWEDATCEQPSLCKGCGATKGSALGHTTDCGVCTRCEKEFRKQSPITISNWTYNIDSAGGVEWKLNIKNNTDKQIKYVTLQWDCYNAVGDLIYDEISWKTYCRMRYTGPLDAHSTSQRIRNTTKFYNYNLKSYKLTEVIVEYMDGTTEKVTNYHDNILE